MSAHADLQWYIVVDTTPAASRKKNVWNKRNQIFKKVLARIHTVSEILFPKYLLQLKVGYLAK
jgi:hypothetical protein